MSVKRTYVGELEWAMEQINMAFYDRNPNREAKVTALVRYGLEVGIARRSHTPLPERPELRHIV